MEEVHKFFDIDSFSFSYRLGLLQDYEGMHKIFYRHYIEITSENICLYFENYKKYNLIFEKFDKNENKLYLKFEEEKVENNNSFFSGLFTDIFCDFFDIITIKNSAIKNFYTVDMRTRKNRLLECNYAILNESDI
jgi:hypothetical protein